MLFSRLNSNVDILEKALDASWLRNEIIAGNIANADTPNYKKKEVKFEQYLADALKSNNKKNVEKVQPRIVVNYDNLETRMDGNNVDVDVEMVEMAKNSIRYNTLISQVSHEFKRINIVLNNIR
ncbi:MAG TPA: flagellar basal body rod protein FlgB [Defluviitaleaceae bacterium]|jgi:flagellar basal-body rod protein FlgB|nr:flagellar basal body rod protein FlgB [Candidatus Epulonipiscium sp.]HOQ17601.1 flagellar basal body rod protein FlgB [Defluviitaleaceae bacterium]HPT75220.1 flagellar basal body rod protein FlgB [Defluviitaleaceae bacterium]HQD50556.1 flagellar basal body rod protein FlgB [Defluviitaleaceae bacterium]